MLKIGLTGGIGSGKTTVARILAKLNFPVYIADREASRLIDSDPVIHSQLTGHFGQHIYYPDHTLNKKALSDLIFNDRSALLAVNSIVHPRVLEDFGQWSKKQQSSFVFFESAIIFEAGLASHFDYLVCVYAGLEERIRRVAERDNTTREKILERVNNQISDGEKCAKCHFTINTDPGMMILEQITGLIGKLNERATDPGNNK